MGYLKFIFSSTAAIRAINLCLLTVGCMILGCAPYYEMTEFSTPDRMIYAADDSTFLSENDHPSTTVLHGGDTVEVVAKAQRYLSYGSEPAFYYVLKDSLRFKIPGSMLMDRNEYAAAVAEESEGGSSYGGSATGAGQTIHTGPRGGRYYINGNGKKTYVKPSKPSGSSGSPSKKSGGKRK